MSSDPQRANARWWTLGSPEHHATDGGPRRDGHQHRACRARSSTCTSPSRIASGSITAYALAFGSLLLLGGRLSDLWGRRTRSTSGSPDLRWRLRSGERRTVSPCSSTARAVQGAFGALLAPAALAALSTTFSDPKERAKAFSIYGAIGGSGAAIGLLARRGADAMGVVALVPLHQPLLRGVAIIGVTLFVSRRQARARTRTSTCSAPCSAAAGSSSSSMASRTRS